MGVCDLLDRQRLNIWNWIQKRASFDWISVDSVSIPPNFPPFTIRTHLGDRYTVQYKVYYTKKIPPNLSSTTSSLSSLLTSLLCILYNDGWSREYSLLLATPFSPKSPVPTTIVYRCVQINHPISSSSAYFASQFSSLLSQVYIPILIIHIQSQVHCTLHTLQ